MHGPFWNEERETLEREALRAWQLKQLRATVKSALGTPFYRPRLHAVGVQHPEDLCALDDLEKLPYTVKDDLREAYPEGLLAVPIEQVVRLHTSSGTTGTPTVIYHTQADLDAWTELVARAIIGCGATSSDIFQNMMGYGLFTGGLGLHYGAERVGLAVIPSSSGNTSRQLRLMRDFKTTVIHATPSYMLHLQSYMEPAGYPRESLALRCAFTGAEAYSEATHRKLEALMDIRVFNSYGLSEMNGPGVAFECAAQDDMHIWEDAYVVEMAVPGQDRTLDEEQEGELVLTTLCRQATPLLRYRTGDLTVLRGTPCACGRTHRRIARIRGRADDMLIVNGVNIYPQQVEAAIMGQSGVGANYQIHLNKKGSLDRMTVRVEIAADGFTGDIRSLERLRHLLRDTLRSVLLVTPEIELHEPGGLPVSEGKAQRVLDDRPRA